MSPVRDSVVVVGRRHEAEHHRVRDFLTRTAQPFAWHEAGTDAADEALRGAGLDPATAELAVVIDGTGAVTGATLERLAAAWNVSAPPARTAYDLAIVGAGPAGLAAAVYAASDGLATVVLERDVPGGQASHTSLIENYFGFPDGIGGAELARLAGRQAERFGAELVLLRGVTGSAVGAEDVCLDVEGGYRLRARAVIAAPGMDWRTLEAEGVEALLGRGIYYGAGRSEAAQCGGDPVVVVGGGNSAGQAVMNLGNAGARVTMLVRGPSLAASMSAYLVDRIAAHPLIEVGMLSEVAGVRADDDGLLSCVLVRSRSAGAGAEPEAMPARALFLCIGGRPRTGWAAAAGVQTDPAGFVLTGPDLLVGGRRPDGWPLDRDPLMLETSVPGLFVAGDARRGSPRRVAGAVGDGATAVAMVHRRLEELAAGGA